MPDRYKDHVAEWTRLHPDWLHIIWDEASLRTVAESLDDPELKATWDSLEHMIQRVDFGRLLVLHRYGGVYVDADTEPLRPLDSLIPGPESGFEGLMVSKSQAPILHWVDRLGASPYPYVTNAFMASTPAAPALREVLRTCSGGGASWWQDYTLQVLCSAGPVAVARGVAAAMRAGHAVVVVDSRFTNPLCGVDRDKLPADAEEARVAYPDAYLLHRYDSAWLAKGEPGRFRRNGAICLLLLLLAGVLGLAWFVWA